MFIVIGINILLRFWSFIWEMVAIVRRTKLADGKPKPYVTEWLINSLNNRPVVAKRPSIAYNGGVKLQNDLSQFTSTIRPCPSQRKKNWALAAPKFFTFNIDETYSQSMRGFLQKSKKTNAWQQPCDFFVFFSLFIHVEIILQLNATCVKCDWANRKKKHETV